MSIEIVEPIGSVDVMFSFFTAKFYLCLEIIGLLVEVHIEAYLVSFWSDASYTLTPALPSRLKSISST